MDPDNGRRFSGSKRHSLSGGIAHLLVAWRYRKDANLTVALLAHQ
jgi:hypothetical protein